MKSTEENKSQNRSSHGVETPEPPQVKNPSEHPSKEYKKGDKKQGKGKSSDKTKAGGEELTPNEEL
jgi:hypothetical protein